MTHIVGTPMKTVTGGFEPSVPSRSRLQVVRGANPRGVMGANSTHAPAKCAHSHALTIPWMWCRGRQ